MDNFKANDRVAVAMLGARMHYAVPRILHQASLLERFFTDVYVGNKALLSRVLRGLPDALVPGAVRRLAGRSDDAIPPSKVTSFDGLGLWYAWALARATDIAGRDAIYVRAAQRFAARIAAVGFGGASAVYAFNTAAMELFDQAKRRGLYCVLEQTILPRRLEDALMKQEAARFPALADRDAPGTDRILAGREEREWGMADLIIAGSPFVAAGLIESGVPSGKVKVVPYGVSERQFPAASAQRAPRRGTPLRALFVGRVGLRKGIPDLMHAIGLLDAGAVELRIAGRIDTPFKAITVPDNVTLLGQVSRNEMGALYAWADVLVTPSILEGSATVTYEALMSGLPVITTPNSGSLVRDGVDGFVVPIRDPAALARAIAAYASDRFLLESHQRNASTERTRVSLDRYSSDLADLMRNIRSVDSTQ